MPASVRPTLLDLDRLKELHGFGRWAGQNRLDRNLFVWRLFFSGRELPEWELVSFRRLAPLAFPPLIQSVWRRRDRWTDALLAIDVLECPSRVAAHEYLVRLLAQFESPLVGRREDGSVGDVAFAGPGRAALVFSRANVVFLIRNAGRTVRPVTDVADAFDAHLVSRPDPSGEAAAPVPEVGRLAVQPARRARGVGRLGVDARHPGDEPFFYKFFSRSGEVVLQQGRLTYRQKAGGRQRLALYVVADPGTVGRAQLEFDDLGG